MILLQVKHFDLVTRVLGYDNDTARGFLLDMHPVSVTRVRRGRPVGTAFIANTMLKLSEHAAELRKYNLTVSMDELFAVSLADEEPTP